MAIFLTVGLEQGPQTLVQVKLRFAPRPQYDPPVAYR